MLSCTMLTFKYVGVNKLVYEMGQRVIFAWSLINPQMKFRLISFKKKVVMHCCDRIYSLYYYGSHFPHFAHWKFPRLHIIYNEHRTLNLRVIQNWITSHLCKTFGNVWPCMKLLYGVAEEQTIKLWSYTITYWASYFTWWRSIIPSCRLGYLSWRAMI